MPGISRSKLFVLAVLVGVPAVWMGLSGDEPVEGPPASGSERVVLLHGLGRGVSSMSRLEEELTTAGYEVHNLGYPSREQSPDELLEFIAAEVEACCRRDDWPVHFVTHSLGGIMVRALLMLDRPPQLGRVVMLAPPNQGSEVVDSIGQNWLFRTVLGPTAEELGTDPDSLPNRLGPPDYPLGILASNRSLNPVASWLLTGDDDGAVKVDATRLEGMTDFREVAATHTFIMRDPETIRQTLSFLRYGRFTPQSEADEGASKESDLNDGTEESSAVPTLELPVKESPTSDAATEGETQEETEIE